MTITNFINDTRIAKAESLHPFQTQIEFIFTDFLPNKNNQGIPIEEAQNIINTAIGMPIKISRAQEKGHAGAIPVGPIQALWMGTDENRDVLFARATIWDLEYPDVAEYLKTAYAESSTIGTSWEIKYETTEEIDGVNWLQNAVCVGTAIVDRPAYGETRTRVLAVAEETTMDEERSKIEQMFEQLNAFYNRLSELYCATYEIEEAEASKIENLDDFIGQFSKLVETIDSRAKSAGVALSEVTDKLTAIETDHTTLQTEIAQLKEDRTFENRANTLAGLFSNDELTAKRAQLLAMSDSAFAEYANDLRKVAKAEVKPEIRVPNFVGKAEVTVDDIITALRGK